MSRASFRAQLEHHLPGFTWVVERSYVGTNAYSAIGRMLEEKSKPGHRTHKGRLILATARVRYNITENEWELRAEVGRPGEDGYASTPAVFSQLGSTLDEVVQNNARWLKYRAAAMELLRVRLFQGASIELSTAMHKAGS